MKELYWTSEAIQDRDAIYAYIEADNPHSALTLDERFTEQAAQLVEHPDLGRRGRVANTREWVVHHNYILVYDVEDGRVRILRALHAARRWPPNRP